MAERVQADLELMLNELEQIQRVGLLTSEETKTVIKKRKRFEYKMQKQAKVKEDILAYIQYECSLLDLIELRRDKIGYLHKKSEIDGMIAKRINKLFRIAEHRFGQVDEKIWITHLAFLRRMDWNVEAGKVLRRFLQTLSHNEEAWIFGSRFEMENQKNVGICRTLLLEGLRFHSDSVPVYREYFMLELANLQNVQNEADNREEVEKCLEILKMVFVKAVEATNEPFFTVELLGLCLHNEKLLQILKSALVEKFGETSSTWTVLATLELYQPKRSASEKMQAFSRTMAEGMNKVDNPEIKADFARLLQQMSEAEPDLVSSILPSFFNNLE